jgi:hypothetical protein
VQISLYALPAASNGPRFAIARGAASEVETSHLGGKMLVVACFAVASKLFFGSKEDVVVVEIKRDRNGLMRLDNRGA